MYVLKEMLIKEQARLLQIEQKTREQLKDVPEGTLRISKSNNHIQYYHCKDGNTQKMGNISTNQRKNS